MCTCVRTVIWLQRVRKLWNASDEEAAAVPTRRYSDPVTTDELETAKRTTTKSARPSFSMYVMLVRLLIAYLIAL
jgi:hypothetical protein